MKLSKRFVREESNTRSTYIPKDRNTVRTLGATVVNNIIIIENSVGIYTVSYNLYPC